MLHEQRMDFIIKPQIVLHANAKIAQIIYNSHQQYDAVYTYFCHV